MKHLIAFLVKLSADEIPKHFFLIFQRKDILTIHANCLDWRRKVKSCFLGKIKKIYITNLSSAELAQRAAKGETSIKRHQLAGM